MESTPQFLNQTTTQIPTGIYTVLITPFYLKLFILRLWILDCCPCISSFPQYEMTMKQIHVLPLNHISFCFIPKSYFWRSILGIVTIISTASQWWRQDERLRKKNQGERTVRFCSMYYIWIISGSETNLKSGINVKIENSNACRRDLGPFPSTTRGARDLAQQRKLIETSEFQSKRCIVFLNVSRCLIIRVNRQLGSYKIFFC